jgi:nucleoside-diphosphate-sugar epimerase
MKLLVTGASGFIGRNVLLRAPREWDILAVYNRTPGLESFAAAHGLTNVRPIACDLTNADAVRALARDAGGAVDACLHLAANGDPAKSVERPAWDLRLNTCAVVTLLEQLDVKHFVYVSSGAVYDRLRGAVTPATPVAPRLPYALSKLASEQYVRSFAERRGRSYINVRFFGAYGPYEAPRKITTRWMRAVIDGQRTFTVRGNGDNLIDFMYVADAVDGFLKLTSAAGFSGTVDFASGTPVTVNDVVRTMARALDVDVAIAHEGRVEEYIEFHSVDETMQNTFGVRAATPFEEGVRRLYRFLVEEARGAGQPA